MKIKDKTLVWLIEQDDPDFYRVDVASYLYSGDKYIQNLISSDSNEVDPLSEEEIKSLEQGGFDLNQVPRKGWLIYKGMGGSSVFVPPGIRLIIQNMAMDKAKYYLESKIQEFESEINQGVTSETRFEKLKCGLYNLKNTYNSLDTKID